MKDIDKVVNEMLNEEEFNDADDAETVYEALDIAEQLLKESIRAIERAVRLSRGVLSGQADKYIIPHLRDWIKDSNQPGSLVSLRQIWEEEGEERY